MLENPTDRLDNIAGVLNRERNVLGLMPHPRARHGAADGVERRL